MDRCHYCGYSKGGHNPNCPHPSPKLDFAPKPWTRQVQTWDRGYRYGRAGVNERVPTDNDPIYLLGWSQGNVALEEYENGHQMWGAPD